MNSESKHDTAAQAARAVAGQPHLVPDRRYGVDQLIQDIARVTGSKPECREFARHAALVAAGRLSSNPLLTLDASCSDPCHFCKLDAQLVLTTLEAGEKLRVAEDVRNRQTRFLAVLAHELRAPLAPIRMAASMLDRVPPADLPKLKGVIEHAVMHMARLVNDLLDASRVSSDKLRLELSTLDLSEVIASAVDECRPALDLRVQHLAVTVPSCDLTLRGDPVRLTQVVQNLLDNASKYTPQEGAISLSVTTSDQQVMIAVSDNGIGISPHALATIFEPFSQEDHAVGFNGVGLGLGLMVVDGLVKAHGGSITVTSEGLGRGTCFLVTLPRNGPPDCYGDAGTLGTGR